ncbi:MAG: hypothetical protein AAB438_02475 [Patescibacteria group bacterium]
MHILIGFIGIVIAIWFLWFFTGGPQDFERQNPGPFLKAPAPLDTGESYGPRR